MDADSNTKHSSKQKEKEEKKKMKLQQRELQQLAEAKRLSLINTPSLDMHSLHDEEHIPPSGVSTGGGVDGDLSHGGSPLLVSAPSSGVGQKAGSVSLDPSTIFSTQVAAFFDRLAPMLEGSFTASTPKKGITSKPTTPASAGNNADASRILDWMRKHSDESSETPEGGEEVDMEEDSISDAVSNVGFQAEKLKNCRLVGLKVAMAGARREANLEELQEAVWQEARGGLRMKKIPVDKTEKAYRVADGPFAAPPLPITAVNSSVVQADELLRKDQKRVGTWALALTRGFVAYNNAVTELRTAKSDPEKVDDIAMRFEDEVMVPFGHLLRMMASRFNELALQRKEKLAKGTRDYALSCRISEADVAFADFMTVDLSKETEAALARVNQRLLLDAVRRPNSRGGGNQNQNNGQNRNQERRPGFQRNFEQQRNGQRPFQAGRPGQGRSWGRQQNSRPYGRSNGGRGRGNRTENSD
jgi:hypothetical protein